MTRTFKTLWVALLSVAGLIGTTLPARANDGRHARCERRVQVAEVKLQNAIQRYGDDSRQARRRRGQLEQERRNCPEYRGERHENMEHHDHDQH